MEKKCRTPKEIVMTVIYKISSIIKPHRVYVGSAVNFKARKSVHISQLRSGKHHSKKLQRHFNKYGEGDIIFSVIESVDDKSFLIKREQFYIDAFSPYFNTCPTAGSNLGRKFGAFSKERSIKQSKALKGKNTWASDCLSIQIDKYSLDGELLTSYKNTREASKKEGIRVRKLTNTNKTIGGFVWVLNGSPLPDFNKLKQSLIDAKKVKNKSVTQINKSGEIVGVFDGVRLAGKATGIDHRSIQSVAAMSNPNRKTAGGFIWKYN
jgi:group I intron endonuclease